MLRFQDLMSRFLDTQRSVMVSYLQGGSPPASVPSLPAPPQHTLSGDGTNRHSSNRHLTVPPLPTSPVPATQPVPVAEPLPPATTPAEQTEATSPNTELDRNTVTARLLDIICKRTGYPAEMLGLDMDLEADLGIDSIKRVEILGRLADANGGQTLNVAMEKLTNIRTLRGIIDCLAVSEGGTEPQPARSASKGESEPLLDESWA